MASKSGQVAIEARSCEHMARDQSQLAVKHCGVQRILLETQFSCQRGEHVLRLHVPCASTPAASSRPRQSPPSLPVDDWQ
jgi:hypothetical protein